jgi:hypothetical protein
MIYKDILVWHILCLFLFRIANFCSCHHSLCRILKFQKHPRGEIVMKKKSNLKIAAVSISAIILGISCIKNTPHRSKANSDVSANNTFVTFEVGEEEFRELPENLVLPQDLDEVNSQISEIKSIFKKLFDLDVSVAPALIEVANGPLFGQYSYHKIEFGVLTSDKFQKINQYYQLPIGKPIERKFDPQKKYSIQDFMVPKIQSLAGKTIYGRLKPQSVSMEPYDGDGAGYIPNCWTTVHDILTSERAPFDLHGFNFDMENNGAFHINLFTKSDHFQAVNLTTPDSIKAYDVYTSIFDESLDHAAVFLAPNLVFEKAAPGSQRYQVRVLNVSDMDTESQQVWRMAKPLPLPAEIPGLSSQEKWKAKNPIRVSLDKSTGLHVPDPSSPLSKLVGQYSPLTTCPRAAFDESRCENFEIRMAFIFDELKNQ